MKNVLFLGLAGYLAWACFGPKKTNESVPGEATPVAALDVFSKYNNRIVADVNGFWMLIKNGKMFSPIDMASITAYGAEFPEFKEVLQVPEDIWRANADNTARVGGSF